jgi:RNA polymerase sigma factor (TIGR02999 family)
MAPESGQVTQLLERVRDGDRSATDELLPLLYDELRAVAGRVMKDQHEAATLQPTALVHEAYLRLFGGESAPAAENRRHFVRVAARAMRAVLVDHVRAQTRDKRGGGRERVPLDEAVAFLEERVGDLLELDEALQRLAKLDDKLARLVELRFFGGLTIEQTAEVLGTSTPTVERSWRTARAFLSRELREDRP